jgi:hypothetical protein
MKQLMLGKFECFVWNKNIKHVYFIYDLINY